MRRQRGSTSTAIGLVALFEDLEQQAAGLGLETRDDEVSELGTAMYVSVDMASRLHATISAQVRVWLRGGLALEGRLARAGADFALVEDRIGSWLLNTPAVLRIEGLSEGAVPEQARPASARLSLRAMLRGLANDQTPGVLHLVGGDRIEGQVRRVGGDFFELAVPGSAAISAIPLSAVAAIRPQR